MSETLEHLSTPDQAHAGARSRCYRILAAAFTYPDAEMCDAIRAGEVSEALRSGFDAVDAALGAEADWSALREAGGEDELAVEFTRLFDVGSSGPPCPLYGGLYGGARMKVMEEALRFYGHFGLRLDERRHELPDHLQTELEFLHYLAFREAEALGEGGDAGPFRRAGRDFLARHPGRFVPLLAQRLEAQHPAPYYRMLVMLLARFLKRDLRHLVAITTKASRGET